MAGVKVNVDNFARAETDRMFSALQRDAGELNRWHHSRVPTPLDHQTVIRMNRDTLYSMAVVDISAGATITIPDAGEQYASVMIVNQDHYINRILPAARGTRTDGRRLRHPMFSLRPAFWSTPAVATTFPP